MREQHLSDEAIAAFADDVLTGAARERARRHTATCAECHHAVTVQREAVWALRAAPAPALPTDLLDRLRNVPATTPVRRVPAAVDDNGNPLLATFAAPVAAFAPSPRPPHRSGKWRGPRHGTLAMTAAAVVGVIAGVAVAADSGPPAGSRGDPAHVRTATFRLPSGAGQQMSGIEVARTILPLRGR